MPCVMSHQVGSPGSGLSGVAGWASSLSVCPINTDVLRFDNTYSLIYSKHVSYTVEVLLPDQTSLEKIEKF